MIFGVGLVASLVAGVVAYQVVGLYGDGAFSSGYHRIWDAETGKSLLVQELRTKTGVVRRVIDGTTVKEVQLDVDAKGREHTIAHVNGTEITRVDRDLDGDGRVDRWEYYDAARQLVKVGFSMANDGVLDAWAYRGTDGQIVKIDVSTRRDGVVDRWEYYEKGQLARVDEDTDHDGKVDRWSTYEGGILMDTATTAGGRRPPDPPSAR
jgi:hypothetical protein